MAHFEIVTTAEEREAVMFAIKEVGGQVAAVSRLAKIAELSQHRTRYALIDLMELGWVERIEEKNFGDRYKRFSYKIIKPLPEKE